MAHLLRLNQIPEYDGRGRLGRHVEHDSRSLSYAFDHSGAAPTNAKHARRIPVLDQLQLGSCTGNAAVGAVGTDPFFDTVSVRLDEPLAVNLYSSATHLDTVAGIYPPTDTGSTGLAVAKATQQVGLIAGYLHALSLQAALVALSTTPVITGVNWYEGFDSPDSSGRVKVSGSVRGGHEFVVDEIDVDNKLVGATNSWGTSFGVNGRFYFSFDDWGRLLSEQGDVTIFVPNTKPAPTPTPTPSPTQSPEDLALWAATKKWALAKGLK